jgi:hypothetical protein
MIHNTFKFDTSGGLEPPYSPCRPRKPLKIISKNSKWMRRNKNKNKMKKGKRRGMKMKRVDDQLYEQDV